MSSYIGVYKPNKDLIMWISTNSQLGMFLKETYNIPQLNTMVYNKVKMDYEISKDENYLTLGDLDIAIREMEMHLIRYEKDVLLKLLCTANDKKENLLEDYKTITEDYQTLGGLHLLSSITLHSDKIMLAIS